MKRTYPSLTGLKGIFILLIVYFHTAPATPLFAALPGNDFLKIYGGSLGNTVFFLLSGVLMTWSYRDRIRERALSFPAFLGRRLKKLYPMYFQATVTMFLLKILAGGLANVNLRWIAFDLLLQSGGGLERWYPQNTPGWFLSALLVCYLAFYFLAYHAPNATAYRAGLVLGIVWGYTLYISKWDLPMCRSSNGIAFLCFFLGCVLAEGYPYLTQSIHRWLQPAAFLIPAASLFLMLRYGVEQIAGDSQIAFAFVVCPPVLYLAVHNPVVSRLLESRPALWLGRISMPLFYWHCVFLEGCQWILSLLGRTYGNLEYGIQLALLLLWCLFLTGKSGKKTAEKAAA